MSRSSLPILSMRLVVNVYLREHDNQLPKIVPLPPNNGLRQILVADVNVLIGDDVFAESAEPFRHILCVLGNERRDDVLRTIATAEMQIRSRLQHRVPVRRQTRTIAAQDGDIDDDDDADKAGDTDRRRALNSMLTKQANDDAEAAASEMVMRLTTIAQSLSRDSKSAVQVLQTIMKELGDKSNIWLVTHLQIENLISTFSNEDESEAVQGGDKVDDDYATDAIWTTPVENDGMDESVVDDVSSGLHADTVASSKGNHDVPDEILHDGSDSVLF